MKRRKKLLAGVLSAMLMVTSVVIPVSAGNIDPTSNAKDVAIQVTAEGAVLLENKDNLLPFTANETKIAVFGRAQDDVYWGGGGSGTVHTSVSYTFIDGFEQAGLVYDQELAKTYTEWCAANADESSSSTFGTMGSGASKEEMPLDNIDMDAVAARNDAAVIIFGRNSSEGSDRTEEKGDWYLSDSEEAILAKVSSAFDKVLVILNTGSLLDVSWIDTYHVNAVLQAWQPGGYGTIAVGRILTGEVNPSGRLMDTWAHDYASYPTQAVASATFGKYVINPVYGEDIYVGYRYFETFDPEAVRYPFGFGLSYTSFALQAKDAQVTDTTVTMNVDVTNTGDRAGKQVVQGYYRAPVGALGNPKIELAAFAKTKELQPGETETVTLSFAIDDMASYDDSGATGHENCYVMEAGDYLFFVGDSVRNVQQVGQMNLEETRVVREVTEVLAPTFSFMTAKAVLDDSGEYQLTMQKASPRHSDNKVEDKWDTDLNAYALTGVDAGIKLGHVAAGYATMEAFISQFTLAELVQIFGGIYGVRTDNYKYFPEGAAGAAGGIGQTLSNRGVNFAVMADGPAGIRLTMGEGETGNTYFPLATAQACSWNVELIQQVGVEVGKEAKYNHVSAWLAPGMNIHRDPLCGRNFEYYSEDPVLSAACATAVTIGVQSEGVAVGTKHFAVNSQEHSRSGGDSIVTERALREIYLSGFEKYVNDANPWMIMTSYNRINGAYAATSYELNTTVLRNEWGFDGCVTTDWASGKDNGNAGLLRAQGDLCMPSLTGRADPVLPEGFSSEGATTSWYGTVHAGEVYCTYCGTKYGDYSLFKINNLHVPANEPCFDAEGNKVEGCERPYETAAVPTLPDSYTHDEQYIYNEKGEVVTEYSPWLLDSTGLITGLVAGDVTLGEIERCATNVFTLLIRLNSYEAVDSAPVAP